MIIPYYNDEGCSLPFVTELKNKLEKIDYDLILVDDCSTDSTPEELDRLAGQRVRVVHNEINLDYGGAIKAGLQIAEGDVVCFTCGDGEVSPEEIVDVFRNIENWEVVKAARSKREDGLARQIITRVFNALTEFRFRLGLKDVNGYPVFIKKEIYLAQKGLRSDWLFNLDLYRKMLANNVKIMEVPVRHGTRLCGRSHMTPRRIVTMVLKYFLYR